jgi:Ca2+-binding RTX toxin-like protein
MFFSSWWRQLANRNSRVRSTKPFRRPETKAIPGLKPLVEALEERWAPAVFTVTNNAPTGAGSLRQALLDSQAAAGLDIITFNLPANQLTIQPDALFPFPTITQPLIIDAKTQSGYAPGNPIVILDGINAGTVSGLTYNGSSLIIIDGMQIQRFANDGVRGTIVGDVTLTDNIFRSNQGDGVEFIQAGRIILRQNRAQQNTGAGVSLTTCSSYTDVDGQYSNNNENGIRLEDLGGDLNLQNVTAINNNFDVINGFGSGLSAFDGFDSNLYAIQGNVRIEGCNFGSAPFGAEATQRQFCGVWIRGLEGTLTVTGFGSGPNRVESRFNFNTADGLRVDGSADATQLLVNIDGFARAVEFNNNLGNGLSINPLGVTNSSINLTAATANNNGLNGLSASNITGVINVITTANITSTFNFNGTLGTGGSGLNFFNVDNINLTGPAGSALGVVGDRNGNAGVTVVGARSLTATEGRFRGNNNGGIRVSDITGDVTLINPVLENNDFDRNGSGDGFSAVDGPDPDTVAINGNLLIEGGTIRATLQQPNERQFRGVFVQTIGGTVTMRASTSPNLPRETTVTGNSDDGVQIIDAPSVTIIGGSFSRNGLLQAGDPAGLANGTGDGLDFDLIRSSVTLVGVRVDDNANHGLEITQLGGTLNIAHSNTVNTTFDRNGAFQGAGAMGGDGINLFNVRDVRLNEDLVNPLVGISASSNRGRGLVIQTGTSLLDNVGVFSNNFDGGIRVSDLINDVTLTRTQMDNNDFDNNGVGDGFFGFDGDSNGFAIDGNVTLNGVLMRDTVAGAVTQQRGFFLNGVRGNVVFQNAGAGPATQQTQALNNSDRGIVVQNGENVTFVNGQYNQNRNGGIEITGMTGTVALTNVTANLNTGLATASGFIGNLITTLNIQGGTFNMNQGQGINLSNVLAGTLANTAAIMNQSDGLRLANNTAITVSNSSFNSNTGFGIHGDTGQTLSLTNVTANSNAAGNLNLVNFQNGPLTSVSVANSTFNTSANGSGIVIANSGIIAFNTVTANGNFVRGASVVGVQAFGDTAGTYSNNRDGGLRIGDINTGVTLVRTTADGNDANDNGVGDGLVVEDVNGDNISINGNLVIQGGRFRGTQVTPQRTGVNIGRVNGSVTLENSTGPVQTMEVTGNRNFGAVLTNVLSATFTNGTYSNNGDDGIRLTNVGSAALTNLTVNNNSGVGFADGLQAANLDSLSVTGSSFNTNGRDGLNLVNVGAVTLTSVTATANRGDGADVTNTGDVTVNNGNYSSNLGNGFLVNVAGNLSFANTTAGNNAFSGMQANNVTSVALVGGAYSGNNLDGIQLAGVAATLNVSGGLQANNNGDDGLSATNVGGLTTVANSSFNNNGTLAATGDGIDLNNVAGVQFDTVTANGNDPGLLINNAAFFTDQNSTYSNNDNTGINLVGIAGNVSLTNVTANGNDADGDGVGDGLNFSQIGGNLTINGGTFNQNRRGIFAQNITGGLTLTNVDARQNVADGVNFLNGVNATFTGGNYTQNGDDGLDLGGFTTITLNNVNAGNNAGLGVADGLQAQFIGTLNVSGGVFNSNSGNGLNLLNVNAVTLTGVNPTGNGLNGLIAENGNTITTGGVFSNNGLDGASIRNYNSIQLAGATANSNAGNGFSIQGIMGVTAVNLNGATANGNTLTGFDITGANTLDMNNITANNNGTVGFRVAGTNVLNLANITVQGNVSGIGGDVINGNQINYTTSTNPPFPANTTDIVFIADSFFQHTRAGNVLQPINYGSINVLCIMFGDGNDEAIVSSGTYTLQEIKLDGGAGIDALTFNGTPGDDVIVVNGLNITINGLPPVALPTILNTISFEALGVNGLGGNDNITVVGPLAISLIVNGGDDDDVVDISGITALNGLTVIARGGAGNDLITGSNFADILEGGSGNDTIFGGAGNDTIFGDDGNDSLVGGTGADVINGGNGDDTIVWNNGDGSDTVNGDAGNDNVVVNGSNNAENFTVNPGAGGRVAFARTTAGAFTLDIGTAEILTVNALGGDDTLVAAAGVTINLFVDGGDGNDSIVGGGGNDTILGGNGNDTLLGGAGNDSIVSGAGDDSIVGGAGSDTMLGGDGNDTFVWNNGDGSDTIDGEAGVDTLTVNADAVQADVLNITGAGARFTVARTNLTPFSLSVGTTENLFVNGLGGNDTITGGAGLAGLTLMTIDGGDGDDSLTGGDGNDTIFGGAGYDILFGLGGVDSLLGGTGNDTLVGGTGDDLMFGEDGDDLLIWNNGDGSDLMEGGAGIDTVQVNGSNAAGDIFNVVQNGARIRFDRTNLGLFTLDIGTTETLDFNGLGGDDVISAFMPLPGITTLNVNGGDGNDLFNIDFTNSNTLPANTTFNGGNGTDTLFLLAGGAAFANETVNNTGPAAGAFVLDGQNLNFVGTEFLNQLKAAAVVVHNTPNTLGGSQAVNGDVVQVVNGPALNGVATTRIQSGNGKFATFTFGNKPNVTINTLDGDDRIDVDNPNAGASLASLRINGGSGADHFSIRPSPTVPYFLDGGDPEPPTRPGDSLDINFLNLTNPTFTPGAQPGSGRWTFGNAQPVDFTNIEDVPGVQIIVVGADLNAASRVRVFSALNRQLLLDFNPFPDIANYRRGARVAAGDVNGDYIPDIIVATGPNATPLVRIFDGAAARAGIVERIASFNPGYAANFKGGLFVATADVDQDGFSDIVVTNGGPATAEVRIFSGATIAAGLPAVTVGPAFLVFPTTFRGGAAVATGDYDGDGQVDLIFSAGPSSRPLVRVVNPAGLVDGFDAGDIIDEFLAFPANSTSGTYVTAVDLNGDGRDEIMVTRRAAGLTQLQPFDAQIAPRAIPPELRVFTFTGNNTGGGVKVPTLTRQVLPKNYTSGVRIGAFSDGGAGQLLVGSGPSFAGQVRTLTGQQLTDNLFTQLLNEPAFKQGYFVAGSKRRDGLPA